MMDSPLNKAHQQARQADMMIKSGKYENAISCHRRAAEHLLDAMQLTDSKPALESMRLQHQHHLRQQDIIQEKQMCAEKTLLWQSRCRNTVSQASQTRDYYHEGLLDDVDGDHLNVANGDCLYKTLSDTDSLLNFLNLRKQDCSLAYQCDTQPKVQFVKMPTDDKTVIEELTIHNKELRRNIQQLLTEVEDLKLEKKAFLQEHSTSSRSHTGEQALFSPDGLNFELPPLEMPALNFDMMKFEEKDHSTCSDDNASVG